jgi:hypothetical protein
MTAAPRAPIQQRAPVQELEKNDACEAVVEEEPRDLEGVAVRPVPQRREVGDREVVDVERLVVALVAGEVQVREVLEDRLVDPVQHEADEDRRQREVGDEERQQQPPRDDEPQDREIRARGIRRDGGNSVTTAGRRDAVEAWLYSIAASEAVPT